LLKTPFQGTTGHHLSDKPSIDNRDLKRKVSAKGTVYAFSGVDHRLRDTG
jgi:hypothetical protein